MKFLNVLALLVLLIFVTGAPNSLAQNSEAAPAKYE